MNAVVQILGKKVLKDLKKSDIKPNDDNPYLERVPVYKDGQIVKYKERERPLPEGLSNNDQEILKKVRRRAYRWDMGFNLCCCWRLAVGWSFFIGLIPVIGDFADAAIALLIVKKAGKIDGGLPKTLYAKMISNVVMDFAIGLVPFVGDLADAMFRANTRNAWLLHMYLEKKSEALHKGQVEDPDTGVSHQVPGGSMPAGSSQTESGPTHPAPTHGRGWGAGRTRQPDVEMGIDTNERPLRNDGSGRGSDGRRQQQNTRRG